MVLLRSLGILFLFSFLSPHLHGKSYHVDELLELYLATDGRSEPIIWDDIPLEALPFAIRNLGHSKARAHLDRILVFKNHPLSSVRMAVVDVVGRHPSRDMAQFLHIRLRSESDPLIRERIFLGLASHGHTLGYKRLKQWIFKGNAADRRFAAKALGALFFGHPHSVQDDRELGERLLQLAKPSDPKCPFGSALLAGGGLGVPVIDQRIGEPNRSLLQIAKGVTPDSPIEDWLGSGSLAVRESALRALLGMEDPVSLKSATWQMGLQNVISTSELVLWLRFYAKHGNERTVDPRRLIPLIQGSKALWVREEALRTWFEIVRKSSSDPWPYLNGLYSKRELGLKISLLKLIAGEGRLAKNGIVDRILSHGHPDEVLAVLLGLTHRHLTIPHHISEKLATLFEVATGDELTLLVPFVKRYFGRAFAGDLVDKLWDYRRDHHYRAKFALMNVLEEWGECREPSVYRMLGFDPASAVRRKARRMYERCVGRPVLGHATPLEVFDPRRRYDFELDIVDGARYALRTSKGTIRMKSSVDAPLGSGFLLRTLHRRLGFKGAAVLRGDSGIMRIGNYRLPILPSEITLVTPKRGDIVLVPVEEFGKLPVEFGFVMDGEEALWGKAVILGHIDEGADVFNKLESGDRLLGISKAGGFAMSPKS